MNAIPRPEPSEFAPYYGVYVAAASEGDLRTLLERQVPALQAACAMLSDEEALHRYADGKWSIKETIGHVMDAERVFAYRALRIGRSDETPMPGFDQNAWVATASFDRRDLQGLIAELRGVRESTLALLDSVEPDAWERRGTASGYEVSLRALAYIIGGHAQHHLRILAERYGLRLGLAATAEDRGWDTSEQIG